MTQTKAQHTPGPWEALCGGIEMGAYRDESAACIRVKGGDPYKHIATLFDYPRETNYANARLLAAAPDLLAILEEALRSHPGDIGLQIIGGTYEECYPEHWCHRARAAIAKAKERAKEGA